MAMMKIVEPYVHVGERIRQTPNLLDIDGSSNVGGVIVAPRGPRCSYVAGPKDFLNKYTVDGTIPRNADISFINAYYMSFSAGLVLARSMNTQAIQGLIFNPKSISELKILLDFESTSLWVLGIAGKAFWYNSGNANFSSLLSSLRSITDSSNTFPYVELASTLETSYESANVAVESLVDFASKLEAHLQTKQTNKVGVSYVSTVGGLVVTGLSSADTLALDTYGESPSSKKVACNVNATLDNATATKIGLEAKPIKFKDNTPLSNYIDLELELTDIRRWAFTFGTMAYYQGPIDKSLYQDYSLKLCSSLDSIINSINGIKGMSAEYTPGTTKVYDDTTKLLKSCSLRIYYGEGNRLYVGSSDVTVGVNYDKLKKVNSADAEKSDPNWTTNYMFGLYPDSPQDSDIYKALVTKDDGNLFQLTLDDGAEENTYTVSLLADQVDQSGNNCYLENLNALGLPFTVLVNSEYSTTKENLTAMGYTEGELKYDNYVGEEAFVYLTPKTSQSFSFGNSGLSLKLSKDVNCLIDALYELEDQELYDIEYLAPFGITNLQFIKNYTLVGRNNDWFAPTDIPYNLTNPNSIKGYFLNVDAHSDVFALGPFDKNVGLTGWLNYIAASTLYYTKVMANKAARKEFAPCFDLTNGILDYTNPVYMFGEEDRVKMLNFKCPVNFLVFDYRHQCHYLNDNRTHQPEINIVSEEQNRRIVNKIKKDLKRLMGRFKGRYNTITTRNDVTSQIGLYFTNNIMNQDPEYTPHSHQVICDETNNTDDIIAANKLAVHVKVKLYNAIKFIDVLVDVFPLNVDFSA